MAFFSVTSTMKSQNGNNVIFVFQAGDGIETIEDFTDELVQHGLISGTRFRVDNREKALVEAKGMLLTRDAIFSVTKFGDVSGFRVEAMAEGNE